jgi:hypothetical protein
VSDRRSQAACLFFVGAMALYLGRSDAALAYVKGGLPPLLVAESVRETEQPSEPYESGFPY